MSRERQLAGLENFPLCCSHVISEMVHCIYMPARRGACTKGEESWRSTNGQSPGRDPSAPHTFLGGFYSWHCRGCNIPAGSSRVWWLESGVPGLLTGEHSIPSPACLPWSWRFPAWLSEVHLQQGQVQSLAKAKGCLCSHPVIYGGPEADDEAILILGQCQQTLSGLSKKSRQY